MRRRSSDAGFDAMHTLDLPAGNRSTDEQIRRFARSDQRVLISKDADFVDSHLLTGHPEKLLLISTGDLSNPALASHFLPLIAELGNYPTVRVPIPSPPAVSAETKFADRRVLGVAAGCGGQPCTT